VALVPLFIYGAVVETSPLVLRSFIDLLQGTDHRLLLLLFISMLKL
jgi:hypothetical protein